LAPRYAAHHGTPDASNLADAECGRPRSSDSLSAARGWVPRDGSDMARALPFCVRRIAVADAMSERSLVLVSPENILIEEGNTVGLELSGVSSLHNVPAKRDAGAVVCPDNLEVQSEQGAAALVLAGG
jgi:hypothetical protein